jgi:hypothetical protein
MVGISLVIGNPVLCTANQPKGERHPPENQGNRPLAVGSEAEHVMFQLKRNLQGYGNERKFSVISEKCSQPLA